MRRSDADATHTLWLVLRNTEGRYSLARADHPVPTGWTAIGDPADRAACLARIEEIWTDMRPDALREAMA